MNDRVVLEVLQASAVLHYEAQVLKETDSMIIRLYHGDHSEEILLICKCLREAKKYTANACQEQIVSLYEQSFESGDMETYKEAQRAWVRDIKPTVESILGFVEPYRDPLGSRAEFEGLVAVVDKEETKVLSQLVAGSATFVRRLPWVREHEDGGKGPFERDLFEAPDYTSLHGKLPATCPFTS